MTYEEALEIAMEELYDAVIDLRYNNKGYEARIEKMCNRLLTARNVLCKELEDAEKKREWVGLTDKEINQLADDYLFKTLREFACAIEAKLKEKNTQ